MGEAKIVGEKIIFNITPSPGASTCLGNAYEDTIKLMDFLDNKFSFNREQFELDLVHLPDENRPREAGRKKVPVVERK
jgi:malate dehydrogenase (quinone)